MYKCNSCARENLIKPFNSHRTGSGGPEAVTLKHHGHSTHWASPHTPTFH